MCRIADRDAAGSQRLPCSLLSISATFRATRYPHTSIRSESRLARWGSEHLTKTGCPPIRAYDFDFGPVVISGRRVRTNLLSRTVARTILDKFVRRGGRLLRNSRRFNVEEIVIENGRVAGIKGHSKRRRVRNGKGANLVDRRGRPVLDFSRASTPNATTKTAIDSAILQLLERLADERALRNLYSRSRIRGCSYTR